MAAVLTRKGRGIVTQRLIGAPASNTEPLNVGWGTGGLAGGPFTAANTDVAPFSESAESRTVGTSSRVTTTTTNDTYQVVGTITATGTRTITEVFLSDSASKPAGTTTVQAGSTAIASNSGTSVILAAGQGANYAANDYVQIRTEVMLVASIATDTLTVTRAQNGSTAISTIASGDQVTRGNAPGTSQVTNGSLFVHADHGANTLNTNDLIAYTIQVSFA